MPVLDDFQFNIPRRKHRNINQCFQDNISYTFDTKNHRD